MVTGTQEENSNEDAIVKDIIAKKFPDMKSSWAHILDTQRIPAKIDKRTQSTY